MVHTYWKEDTLVFVPTCIVRLCNENVLRAAESIVSSCSYDRISILVDCSDLTKEDCIFLWKKSTYSEIKRGFSIFKTLPCRVDRITLINPCTRIKFWNSALVWIKRMMSSKMKSRLHILDDPSL